MNSRIFQFHKKANDGVKELLSNTTLGSNGAKYQLLDTKDKIDELDSPLFLTLQRNEKVVGNVTFCRRRKHWYIRYFAFDNSFQSSGQRKMKKKEGVIKRELHHFFDTTLNEGFKDDFPQSFYAYIDPKNVNSLWMTEQFGFDKIGEKATQTFSRYAPKQKMKIKTSTDWSIVPDEIKKHFRSMNYFFEEVFFTGEFVYSLDENNKMIAFSKVSVAHWKIERLPGKFGGVLVKAIPFIPVLNRLIKPKRHTFIVPEAVWVKENNSIVLSSFFESILVEKRQNLIIWWVDINNSLYQRSQKEVKWGLVHSIIGISPVYVVTKSNDFSFIDNKKPIYSAAMDSF